jgi:hypothetical protein
MFSKSSSMEYVLKIERSKFLNNVLDPQGSFNSTQGYQIQKLKHGRVRSEGRNPENRKENVMVTIRLQNASWVLRNEIGNTKRKCRLI